MNTKETVSVLTDLLHVSNDGEQTFQKALDLTEDPKLESAFRTTLESCMLAARQLEKKIDALDGTAKSRGTVSGAFRRAWMDARTTLASPADKALLDEIVRAERAAVRHYDEALAQPLGEEARSLVTSQAAGAKANLRRFEELAAEHA
jgi:uncharacterized protein (TIGR02284 family)